MKIKEVIIVEGKHDTAKMKQAVDADTIETNGSAIDKETLNIIQHAQQKRGVIIFTDPDYPGERIRHIIDQHVPGCKHAFLPKKNARSASERKSVGIEHASVEAIRHALAHVYELTANKDHMQIDRHDLMRYGLIAGPDAKALREELGELLHIGYTNGKQLIHRLHMFQITKNELDSAMQHILEKRGSYG